MYLYTLQALKAQKGILFSIRQQIMMKDFSSAYCYLMGLLVNSFRHDHSKQFMTLRCHRAEEQFKSAVWGHFVKSLEGIHIIAFAIKN